MTMWESLHENSQDKTLTRLSPEDADKLAKKMIANKLPVPTACAKASPLTLGFVDEASGEVKVKKSDTSKVLASATNKKLLTFLKVLA